MKSSIATAWRFYVATRLVRACDEGGLGLGWDHDEGGNPIRLGSSFIPLPKPNPIAPNPTASVPAAETPEPPMNGGESGPYSPSANSFAKQALSQLSYGPASPNIRATELISTPGRNPTAARRRRWAPSRACPAAQAHWRPIAARSATAVAIYRHGR
jgi:hypothetical protein